MTGRGPTVYTGFDSAWTRGRQGAIASVRLNGDRYEFLPPVPASFEDALTVIESHGAGARRHLIAIDQPLIVPNQTRSRPCEAAVRPVICRLKGGVQPANRDRREMFGDNAPIWAFLHALDAEIDPLAIRSRRDGRYAFEVYPALAAAGLSADVWARRRLFKYNPDRRRTFSMEDWHSLCQLIGERCAALGLADVHDWCRDGVRLTRPKKADQDALDAVICTLIALLVDRSPGSCLMIGDVDSGYIVTPAGETLRAHLEADAGARSIPVRSLDGT